MEAPENDAAGRSVRDAHRLWLGAHFAAMLLGLLTAVAANRFLTPEVFWVHWVALGWGALFAVHLAIFTRATLATLSEKGDG